MTDPVNIDIPQPPLDPAIEGAHQIKWCEGHWTELLMALKERGLDELISGSPEELSMKLAAGEMDPCWEACNLINMGALECFGPETVVGSNAGCPVCAFANIVQHMSDLMAVKYRKTN